MQVHFWGTRGSLSAPLTADRVREKVLAALQAFRDNGQGKGRSIADFVDQDLPFSLRGTYGGNTACVEIRGGREILLCDAGTGLRDFSAAMNGQPPATFHILVSHPHWDHLQGFPFFTPAYLPGNTIVIHGCHDSLEEAFRAQQRPPFFPVPLDAMRATLIFNRLTPDRPCEIAGFSVLPHQQNHPGDSYGYRIERDGRSVVYATDAEHFQEADRPRYPYLDFINGTDLLIFDAQYTHSEALGLKENWGHSSNIAGIELAVEGKVKRLCLFHHEHTAPDAFFDDLAEKSRAYLRIHDPDSPLEILLAYDGLTLEV